MFKKNQIIIKNQANNGTSINISDFADGIYYLVIKDITGKPVSQKRFTKIK